MTEPSEKERALTTVVSADNFNLFKILPLLTLVLEGNRVSTKNSLKLRNTYSPYYIGCLWHTKFKISLETVIFIAVRCDN